MARALVNGLVRHDAMARPEELPDDELLEQFLGGRGSASQEAFRALVERHGPMVMGVCRCVFRQHADAEDAFQATFLVLARNGGSIRNRRALAGWLHEVAHRVAVKARARSVRGRGHGRQVVAFLASPANFPDSPEQTAAWDELLPVLHEEVNRLPDKYRLPVILSCLMQSP